MSTVEIIPRTTLTFDTGSNRPCQIVLAKYLDTLAWREGGLLVRLHVPPTSGTGSSTFQVVASPVSYCDEEPNMDFLDTSGSTSGHHTVVAFDHGSPSLVLAPFVLLPPQLRVVLNAPLSYDGTLTISVQAYGRP